jgi:thioredoxin
MLKSLQLLVLAALCCLASSCDKVRSLVSQLEKKIPGAATGAPAAPTAAQATEIPQEIGEMFPVQSRRIVIVDYYADWCGPCRMLSPLLEKIADENPKLILVCKVNVDKFRELATKEGVKSIPDVRIFRDGKLVDQFVGALPAAALQTRLDGLMRNLPAAPAPDAAVAKPKAGEPSIRTMPKDWLPPGIKRR